MQSNEITEAGHPPQSTQRKHAHAQTVTLHQRLKPTLDFSDGSDFEDARRGFIGTIEDATIRNVAGQVVWSQKEYAFLEEREGPFTVNPSLWRMSPMARSNSPTLGHPKFPQAGPVRL